MAKKKKRRKKNRRKKKGRTITCMDYTDMRHCGIFKGMSPILQCVLTFSLASNGAIILNDRL